MRLWFGAAAAGKTVCAHGGCKALQRGPSPSPFGGAQDVR